MKASTSPSAQDMRFAGDSTSSGKTGLKRFLTARWGLLIRLALATALIALLFRFGAIDVTSLLTMLSSPSAMIAAFTCVLVAIHLGILRWDLLLRLQGIRIPFVRLWHFTFVGNFTGIFVPGGLGQDAVRVFYAAREPNCSVGPALTSIVADRLTGLTGLLLAATIFVIIDLDNMARSPVLRSLALITGGAALTALVLLAMAVALGNQPALRRWLRALTTGSGTVARLVAPVIDAARYYHGHIGGVLVCLGISVLVHLFSAMAVMVLAMTMALPSTWFEIGLASLLSFLANILPLTPGGLGVGEGVFDQICRLLTGATTMHSYASAFFLARAVSAMVALLGAASYVWHSGKK